MPSIKDVNFYNRSSSISLGWKCSWLNCQEDIFDAKLVEAIKQFQKDNKLTIDGLLGPATFKKLYTYREAQVSTAMSWLKEKEVKVPETRKYISYMGEKKIVIPWDKVDTTSLCLTKNFKPVKRDLKLFVIHHDAALSSKSCFDILKRRNLSVQFSIDNDGTIYQMTDLNLHAMHAGLVNEFSVGVEISNAVELKYQSYYKSKGFGERTIVGGNVCNGKNYGKMLGFYDCQLNALRILIKTVCGFYNIPIQTPNVDGFYKPAFEGKYSGIVCHYHVDPEKRKYDPIQLKLQDFIKTIA